MEVACLENRGTTGTIEITAQTGEDVQKMAVLVQGSTWATVWHMAWPLTVNMLALSAMNLFEGWIAGRFGADTQAAVGVGGQLWFLFMMMTLALSAGTTATISRFCGAGDTESAVKAGRQALICAVVLSSISTVTGWIFCRSVLRLFGASGAVEEQGCLYLNTCLLSMVPYTVLWVSNSIFRASGNAVVPMVTMVTVFALIALFDFVFCLGRPLNFGVSGIGISWTLCGALGVAVNVFRLKQTNLREICNWRAIFSDGLSLTWLKRFLAVGVPACIQDLAVIGGSLGVFFILSKTQHPQIAQAAWAAGWRLEETSTLMPMYGLNLAAASIVGQNLGARMPERATLCGWQVMSLGAAINVGVALVMFLLAPQIASLISCDQSVASSCRDYLRIVCWTEPFFACWRILTGAMQGAGYTVVPMYATVFAFAILRVSLAALLLYLTNGNANSVWLSMAVSTVVAGLIMIFFWWHRRWQLQKV